MITTRSRPKMVSAAILGGLLGTVATSVNATEALFNLQGETILAAPFPSDRFTLPDSSQNTGLRVNLPEPDCSVQISDCQDIDVLNELDGFNVQPRLSIPFSGPIDVTTVSSDTVFLIPLASGRRGDDDDEDDEEDDDDEERARPQQVQRIGINQIVWDVATNTLHVESDEQLAQHARYVLIVTRGIKDEAGRPVEASRAFERFRGDSDFERAADRNLKTYRKALLEGLAQASAAGIRRRDIVAASVFTTQSVTAILEKIRDQIKAATPEPADFVLGNVAGGPARTVRTVFANEPTTSITFRAEVRTAPTTTPPNDFATPVAVRRNLLRPGTVGTLAFGSYRSPVYLNASRFIPQVGTRTGEPLVQGVDEVFFTLFLPAVTTERPRPAGGWPVAIYGPGCCGSAENKESTPYNVAATLAEHGIATIAINAAGQGFGPRSTLSVTVVGQSSPTILPAGARSIDLDNDGNIGPGEGAGTPAPRRLLFGRDPVVQTIADLLQLVRVIEVGVDVDGDAVADLDPSRISYVGLSAGAMRGVPFVAVEPKAGVAALAVAGGVIGERLRLGPGSNRGTDVGTLLAERTPSLLNAPGVTKMDGVPASTPFFNDNMPLRDGFSFEVQLADNTGDTVRSPVINTAQGAMDIQRVLEHLEWANMPADAAAFAPYLQKAPLAGMSPRPVLMLFAKGDRTVPNPTTTAILRAGDLTETTYYRTDLAVMAYGAGLTTNQVGVETNGHFFLVRMNSTTRTQIALAAQSQVAKFLQSDGQTLVDPDGPCVPSVSIFAGCVYEAPIEGALPEDLSFIPDP